jgi:hypothetical protein
LLQYILEVEDLALAPERTQVVSDIQAAGRPIGDLKTPLHMPLQILLLVFHLLRQHNQVRIAVVRRRIQGVLNSLPAVGIQLARLQEGHTPRRCLGHNPQVAVASVDCW